jgi:hypothetical protein
MEWPNLKGEISKEETKPFHFSNQSSPLDDEEWLRYLFHDGKVAREIDSRHIRDEKARQKYLDIEFSCVFPFTHGSSLAVNQALLVSDQLGLIPFTDSELHHQLIEVKYQRACDGLGALKRSSLSGIPSFHPEKLRYIAFTLFDTIIPKDSLERISIAQAAKYRDSCQDSFERLKQYIAEITSQIESEVWDDRFQAEVQKIVYGKIVPEAQEAQNEALEIYEKLFGELAKKAVAALTPTLGVGIFAGLTFSQILLAGSASILGSVFPDLLDVYLARKKLQRNSVAYLLRLVTRNS